MKHYHLASIIFIMAFVSLTGCQQTPNATQSAEPVKSKTSVSLLTVPALQAVPIAETPKSVETTSQGRETGDPKEEPVVSNSNKPVKLSSLKPIYSVGKGNVAITIDDGPTKFTGELLKILKEQNTHVTFFFIGQNAAAHPESVTEAVYLGHEVGYHSDTHPHMSKMNYDEQEKEFDNGLAKIKKSDNQHVALFRPPYGAYNNDTKLITEEHHMGMVLWNEDPQDWASTDPAKIAQSVLSQVHSGSIIVMHDHPSTIAALPAVIKGIKSKGYKLVTVPNP